MHTSNSIRLSTFILTIPSRQIGSTEWVEEFGASLSTSVIAYLNVDSAASGYYFSASIVPSLASVLRSTLELVADPTPGQTRTLLQAAIADAQFSDPQATNPKFTDLGSGSDFTPFFQHLGLPATDFAFHGVAGVYHSIYDSYTWIEQFGDPGFRMGPTMANVLGLLAIALADSLVLPFDYTECGHPLFSPLDYLTCIVVVTVSACKKASVNSGN